MEKILSFSFPQKSSNESIETLLNQIVASANLANDGFAYSIKGDKLRLSSHLKDDKGTPLILQYYRFCKIKQTASPNYFCILFNKMKRGYNRSSECQQEKQGG